jgi:Chalcone isomerase-like
MHRRAILVSLALPTLAQAAAELNGLTKRGQARFRFFGLHVYDIRLWSAAPVTAANWQEQPLALEIEYARSLDGAEIAKRSLKEMRRQATVTDAQAQAWLAQMQAAFPDVKAGDRITGTHEPGVAAQFFVNGQPSARVADAQFARLFFGIWLSPQTSEPALREQLLPASDGRP